MIPTARAREAVEMREGSRVVEGGGFAVSGMAEKICPHCEDTRIVECGTRRESLVIRGERVRYTAFVERCAACGGFFADGEQEHSNIQSAYGSYRKRAGLLRPEEVWMARISKRMRPEELDRALGWPVGRIVSIEAGHLQTVEEDAALRAAIGKPA